MEEIVLLAELGLVMYLMLLLGATADGNDCNQQQQNSSESTLGHRVKLIKEGNFYSPLIYKTLFHVLGAVSGVLSFSQKNNIRRLNFAASCLTP